MLEIRAAMKNRLGCPTDAMAILGKHGEKWKVAIMVNWVGVPLSKDMRPWASIKR
jgi:hypothetical protein